MLLIDKFAEEKIQEAIEEGQFNDICIQLLNLIEEYNEEIRKATLKKRDMFRNFTTMGTRCIQREQDEFKKLCLKIQTMQ